LPFGLSLVFSVNHLKTSQYENNLETYTLFIELPKGIAPVHFITHNYEYNELGYPVKVDGETTYSNTSNQ
jgi:hypothetical protein